IHEAGSARESASQAFVETAEDNYKGSEGQHEGLKEGWSTQGENGGLVQQVEITSRQPATARTTVQQLRPSHLAYSFGDKEREACMRRSRLLALLSPVLLIAALAPAQPQDSSSIAGVYVNQTN